MPYEILFDWNGTIADDAARACFATNAALDALGAPRVAPADFDRKFILPMDERFSDSVFPGTTLQRRHPTGTRPWPHGTHRSAAARPDSSGPCTTPASTARSSPRPESNTCATSWRTSASLPEDRLRAAGAQHIITDYEGMDGVTARTLFGSYVTP